MAKLFNQPLVLGKGSKIQFQNSNVSCEYNFSSVLPKQCDLGKAPEQRPGQAGQVRSKE